MLDRCYLCEECAGPDYNSGYGALAGTKCSGCGSSGSARMFPLVETGFYFGGQAVLLKPRFTLADLRHLQTLHQVRSLSALQRR